MLSGCGSKTPQKAKSYVEVHLPVIQNVEARYKSGELILSWTLPERLLLEKKEQKPPLVEQNTEKRQAVEKDPIRVPYLRLNVGSYKEACSVCEKNEAFFFKITKSGIAGESIKKLSATALPTLQVKEKHYRLRVPKAFFELYFAKDGTYLTLDYETTNGEVAASSDAIELMRPLELPLPRVTSRVEWIQKGTSPVQGESRKKSVSKKMMKLLYLTWQPQEVGTYHLIEGSGKTRLQKRYLGLNFYYKNKKGDHVKINPIPKFDGKFLLINFYLPLYATSVGHHKNESGDVLVYDGKRR